MTTAEAKVQDISTALAKDSFFSSADEIWSIEDIQHIDVMVPQWGNRKIRLRTLTALEAIRLEEAGADQSLRNDFSLVLVMLTAINPDGKRLFIPDTIDLSKRISASPEFMASLMKFRNKGLAPVRLLQNAAMDLNGLGKSGQAAVKEAKNDSSEVQPDASPTV